MNMKKKGFLSIIALVILALVMIATCPKEKDHKDAICLAINKAVDEKLGDSDLSLQGFVNFAGKWVIKQGANLFIDSYVTVENYGLLSIGRYTFNDRNSIISVGMFNHVFTFSKDDVLEEVEKHGL